MSDWQRRLKLQPEWDQAGDGTIPIQELAKIISNRLSELAPFPEEQIEEERLDLAAEFKCLSVDSELTYKKFNHIMNALYDWADTSLDHNLLGGRKVCWVDIF